MKITLSSLKLRQPIERLAIRSTELSLYLAEVEIEGERHIVCEDGGKPLRTVNLVNMREKFVDLDIREMVLVQESAYDEMIGQPAREGSNSLEVPLETFPSWLN